MTADPGSGQSSITYIPLPKDASNPAMALLFTHEAEYFVHTKDLAGNSQVLTVLDDYSIGAGSDFEDDTQSPHTSMWVEALTVSGEFKATNLQLSASQITSQPGAALNVSGAPIEPFSQPVDKGDGAPGHPGNPAGTLALYTETEPADPDSKLALPSLIAIGGAGQRGQSAPQGTGGAGGRGGNGGHIAAYLASPYLRANADMSVYLARLDGLDAINQLAAVLKPFDPTIALADGTTLKQAVESILAWGARLFPDKSQPNTPVTGAPAIAAISGLGAVVHQVSERFGTLTDNLRGQLLGALHESVGAGALGGSGTNTGAQNSNGPVPVNGSAQLTFRADSAAIDPTAKKPDDNIDAIVRFISLTQCQMLLAKAKMTYLQADSVANPQALTDTAKLLQRLVQRLAFVPALAGANGKMPDPRLQPYRTVYLAASSYLANLSKGLDYYGNPPGAVPLVNFSVLSSSIDSQLAFFKQAEQAYADYFVALQKQNQTRDQIAAAGASAQAAIAQSHQVIGDLASRLENLDGQIAAYATPIEAKKEVLTLVMDSAVNDVNAYYNFTWADGFALFKDILGAVTSVAFMPESPLMGVTQGIGVVGDLVNTLGVQATTTITNDQGVSVNKANLVNQVVSVEDSVKGLSEGYQQLDNGQLQPDDPGAAKLLMLESQFEKVMGSFQQELPDDIKAVEKAFQDYIAVVVDRNNTILQYNAYVNVIGSYLAQQQQAQQLLDQVHSKSFDDQDPGLPSLVSAMGTIYQVTRDQLMATLYNASRALQFWSLSNSNFLASGLSASGSGLSPSSIDYGFVSTQLHQAWLNGLAAFRTNPSPFPASISEDGAIIEFSDDATLTVFRTEQAVTLQVPAIRAPGGNRGNVSTLDPKWKNSLLVDQCNVRLTDMRVWLDGVKVTDGGQEVDDVLNIRVTHGGYSVLVSSTNQVFRFDHDNVVKTFQYHTIERDPLNVKRLRPEMEANFGDLKFGDPTQSVNFTLLSPFAEFTIELENEVAAPTAVPLAQAVAGHQVAVGTLVDYGGKRPAAVSAVTTSGGSAIVTLAVLGVVVQKFTVTGSTVTDKSGAAAAPSALIPASGGRQIDLSGLTAIRLEFTGTSYTFAT